MHTHSDKIITIEMPELAEHCPIGIITLYGYVA